MKGLFPALAIVLLFGLIVSLFWEHQFKHYMSEASDLHQLKIPQEMLAKEIGYPEAPLLLHFYDENCLIARSNLEHALKLMERYQDAVKIVVIAVGEIDTSTFCRKLPAGVAMVHDKEAVIAKSFDVQRTPHAILFDTGETRFRGNYVVNGIICGPYNMEYSAPAIALKYYTTGRSIPLFKLQSDTGAACKI